MSATLGVRWLTVATAAWLTAGAVESARIGLNPLMADGAAGRTTVLTGSGFEPGVTYEVRFGGFPAVPSTVNSDAAGAIAPTTLTLPDLPGGNLDVMLASPALTRSFTGAFRVWPNVCLSPIVGDGRFGETWQTNAAIPSGGWVGMVIRVEGTGFAGGYTIPADSILVGGVACRHPAIPVSAQGRIDSTTILVASDLSNGFKDVVINDGVPQAFAGAYQVRRSIGLTPARGFGAAGATILIEGWGFVPGNLGAISIGAAATTQVNPATIVVAADGSFRGVIRLNGNPGDATVAVVTAQEAFPACFDDCKANQRQAGIVPVTPSGLPNQAVRVQGTGNWTSGQSIAANSSLIMVPGADVTTTHPAIPIAGGRFGPAWIVAGGPVQGGATGVAIVDPVAGVTKCSAFWLRRTISECPVVSGGLAGFTATVSGWGFPASTALSGVTVGGQPAAFAPTTTSKAGDFGPMPVTVGAMPFGPADLSITDSVTTVFGQVLRVRRTIGLSFVVGPGASGDATAVTGFGFAPGTIAADSARFVPNAATHGAIAVAADGSFGASALTLPVLAGGPWNMTIQDGEVFPAAFHVADPVVAVSKHREPGYASYGTIVTYSISYTNVQPVGDPRAVGLVLIDTLPTRTQYVAGSATSALPATIEWWHPGCSCWNGVDTPAADVRALRWTLASPLPAGASGYVGFQVVAQ